MADKPFINFDELDWSDQGHGDGYKARTASIGTRIGAQNLGYRLVEVEPGKAAWPRHSHLANEEAFIILGGKGEYRRGEQRWPVREGDTIAAPPGEAHTAHQLRNVGREPLRYLAISTMREPDVMLYPDSDKFGVFAGSPPGGDKSKRTFSHFGRQSNAVDYWDGEDER